MAKYTTTVRSICEELADSGEVGFSQVDAVIQKACPKIFTSTVPLFDAQYKEILLRKILKHYYMREIGYETVGLWQLKMNTRLEEIAPYYTFLYENGLGDLNPYEDTDLSTSYGGKDDRNINLSHEGSTSDGGHSTDTKSGTNDRTENLSSESNGTDNVTVDDKQVTSGSSDSTVKESDTPQGGISGLTSDKYLTNASITDNNNSQTVNTDRTDTTTSNATSTGTNTIKDVTSDTNTHEHENQSTNNFSDVTSDVLNREFLQKVSGRSGKSPIEIFKLIRENFYNLDMLVIEEFSDLFMTIY